MRRGFVLGLDLGTAPGFSGVFIDGGLDAQTIRLEGNTYCRTLGGSGIIIRHVGPECTSVGLEEPFFGQLSSVTAHFSSR